MQGSKYSTVAVMNRGDFPLTGIQYDGEEIVWQPRETKHLLLDVATHCLRKSAVRWDPVTQETVRVLAEVKPGDPEPELLSWEEAHPDQLLVTDNLPDTHFDDEGRPLPRGEVKRLAPPTAMLRGRIPGGAGMGVPPVRGAAGTGLGAKEALPSDIEQRLAAHTEQLIEQADQIAG